MNSAVGVCVALRTHSARSGQSAGDSCLMCYSLLPVMLATALVLLASVSSAVQGRLAIVYTLK